MHILGDRGGLELVIENEGTVDIISSDVLKILNSGRYLPQWQIEPVTSYYAQWSLLPQHLQRKLLHTQSQCSVVNTAVKQV